MAFCLIIFSIKKVTITRDPDYREHIVWQSKDMRAFLSRVGSGVEVIKLWFSMFFALLSIIYYIKFCMFFFCVS